MKRSILILMALLTLMTGMFSLTGCGTTVEDDVSDIVESTVDPDRNDNNVNDGDQNNNNGTQNNNGNQNNGNQNNGNTTSDITTSDNTGS